MLTSRQKQLLCLAIQEYVQSADPVGSNSLVKKYKLKISPATVRNELAELEKRGYMSQPHTSAGRIPTEKAYQYFVDKYLEYRKIIKLEKALKQILDNSIYEQGVKNVAKLLSQLSGQAIIIGFKFNHAYYTGLSNLFRQNEFQQYRKIINLSATLDRMDDLVGKIFDGMEKDVDVYIGHQNPFGNQSSLVISRFKYQDREPGILGLLGPLRMDYNKNYSLVRQTQEVINNF